MISNACTVTARAGALAFTIYHHRGGRPGEWIHRMDWDVQSGQTPAWPTKENV